MEQCYYRVAQEALENVIRHAHATRVSVALRQGEGQLVLEVSNDGRGFAEASTPPQNRLGIKGMHERADLVGGTLKVESRVGEGTTVRLTMESKDDSGAYM